MHQHHAEVYERRWQAFGWETAVVDGHDVAALKDAFARARQSSKPFGIVARTLKGKGVSFVEDKEGWHGKPLKKGEELTKALAELGDTNVSLKVEPRHYEAEPKRPEGPLTITPAYEKGQEVATREAFGAALAKLAKSAPQTVAVDGDTKNSTFSDKFKAVAPERFAEGYIAEQNMVGIALGMSTEGKIPIASTFACFLSRAYDFIRMAVYSRPKHLVLCGSHAGVSIGEDGPSQMALEDLAMMRALVKSTVLYPSDAVCAEKCVELAARTEGIVYIRTSRPKTKILYANDETFPLGGSKTLRRSDKDAVTIVAAGVTLFEALTAHETLQKDGVAVRVIDLYLSSPWTRHVAQPRRPRDRPWRTTAGVIGEAVARPGGSTRLRSWRRIPRPASPRNCCSAWDSADAMRGAQL
jgi:transketolase